jgi:hypothetical protein
MVHFSSGLDSVPSNGCKRQLAPPAPTGLWESRLAYFWERQFLNPYAFYGY